jgi:hypothetical protein
MGGGTASATLPPSKTHATNSGTARVSPVTNNYNYCWSHGYQIHVDHTSMACTRRAEGHQELATKTNNMGGRQWGRDAACRGGAASTRDKHINHYNHCLPYTGCTPSNKHIAIVDSGCTCHSLMVTALVANKQVAKTPIHVTLPDGASIQSSHTCHLVLHQLPDTAKKAHVIPGLSTSSLLSVGQLVDAERSVTFEKAKLQVLHKNANILEGQRNLRNRLWKVDLQGKTSHPALSHPPPANVGKSHKDAAHLAEKNCEAHSVYECSNKLDLVRFLHAATFSPVPDTWINSIRAGHFATWPGLTEDLVTCLSNWPQSRANSSRDAKTYAPRQK